LDFLPCIPAILFLENPMPSANHRRVAIALAFAGTLPSPLPLAWLHKFYLGQYLWGIVYLVLTPTLLPQIASALEGVWYLTQSDEGFLARFPTAGSLLNQVNNGSVEPYLAQPDQANGQMAEQISSLATSLRDLDQLRLDGLITEYEFEQKRRSLLK
jgi:TM2 domain-containing membrane protein YozV